MSKNWFWIRALATLFLIGLLAVGGYAVFRTAWSSGYSAGQMATGGEEGVTTPSGPVYPLRPYGFAPYRPFGGGLALTIFLGLVFFGVISKLIRFVIWGSVWRHGMTGPWFAHRGHWHRVAPRYRKYGPPPPMPPWYWGWGEADEEDEASGSETE
jgi:hypothetical protein